MGQGQARAINSIKSALESLNESITSIYTKNGSFINNNQAMGQHLNFEVRETGKINCETINILQSSESGISTTVNSDVSSTTKIQNALDSAINSTVDQMAKSLAEAIGGDSSSENYTNLKVLAKNIISNNVNTSNIAQATSVQAVTQDLNFLVLGEIKCGDNSSGTLTVDQHADIRMASATILKTVSDQLINNSEINRIVQDIQQKATSESKGGLIIIIIFVIIAVILVATKSWKLLIMLAVLAIIAGFLKYFEIWPFNVHRWGCSKDEQGFNSGSCKEFKTDSDGPYGSKGDCEKNCKQYWGCGIASGTTGETDEKKMYTNVCTQYDRGGDDGNGLGFVKLSPYSSKEECTKAKMCSPVYGCDLSMKNVESVTPQCIAYNQDDPQKPEKTYTSLDKCNPDTCAPSWYKPDTKVCECAVSRVNPAYIPSCDLDPPKGTTQAKYDAECINTYKSKKECLNTCS